MELGMVGLGRMGGNMAQRLVERGHRVVGYDRDVQAVQAAVARGAEVASSLDELAQKLARPRAVWLMLPAGEAIESVVNLLVTLLGPGDTLVDGGNSYYKDSLRRAALLRGRGIAFLDVGTSGGIWGFKEGYCLMVGGEQEAFRRLEPVFQSLAPAGDRGYGHVGPSGAGHFVKMVHNGVEYGLMQIYAEGFELLSAKKEFSLDLRQVAEVWRYGSVVRSWLLDLVAQALAEDPTLKEVQAYVEDSGEGRWAVQESVELGVPLPVIALSLQARFRSRQEQPFGGRLLAVLRRHFGGHAVRKAK